MPPKNNYDKFNFTHEMDEVILDSLLHQATLGQRPGGTFTTMAYNSVLEDLESKFPNVVWCKEKFKNRLKYMKKNFAECYDSFRNVSKNDFGYNPTTKKFDLEDEVWAEIIKTNPKAADWRDKPMPLFEKLQELFGKDRATGENASTAAEIRGRRKLVALKQGHLIADIDQQVSRNELEIEGIESFSDFAIGSSQTSPCTPHSENSRAVGIDISASKHAGNNAKGNKKKRRMDVFLESCNDMLSANIDKVISAKKPPAPGNVMQCLQEMNFDQRFSRKAYFHLSRNRVDFDIVVGLPLGERGSALWDMLVEANVISELEPSPYDPRFM